MFDAQVGAHLDLNALESAEAVLRVAVNELAGAVRLVSVEKGKDPRDFALMSFGGAGPLHAVAVARHLGIPTVLVPRFPGLTSALGCIMADVRHDFVHAINLPLSRVRATPIDALFAEQLAAGRVLLDRESVPVKQTVVRHEADLLYQGQSHVLRLGVESPGFDPDELVTAFADRFSERFGIRLDEMKPVLVNVRTTVIGARERDFPIGVPSDGVTLEDAIKGLREVRFDGSWCRTRIYDRESLPHGVRFDGPAIVEQLDATIVIDPGARAAIDELGNMIVTVGSARYEKVEAGMNIDPVTLTVIEKGLQHVCSEMDLTHDRTAFSPVISEAFDRSNGIYRPSDGGVIAQGELGMPIFIGVMQETTREVIEHRNDLGDGDIILVNDPYFGGTHLMDVKMVKPFFYSGRLWCFLSNTGHWPDTGGMVPGGFSSTATEIHQEGLRIPPVKLVRRGEIQQDIVDLVLANVRVSQERIGDIKAQIGALDIGEKRLRELLDRYGADTVEAAIEELEVRSERMMRSKIRTIPDGSYSSIAYIDSDGIVDEPLEIRLTATIADDEIELDLGGSSPPCLGPMNSVWASTLSGLLSLFQAHLSRCPHQRGLLQADQSQEA